MYPPRFEYLAPGSLEEAVVALAELGPGARPLAGGQSLIPLMRLRLVAPTHLVDLRGLPLAGVERRDGRLRVGATTTHAALERDPVLARDFPLLADAARVVGDPLVRNLGTVGGSAAHADPAGDWGAALLAARAWFEIAGPDGTRGLPADEFFTGSFETALAPGELLVAIHLERRRGSGGAYLKLHRKVGDFALVGVAVQLVVGADGRAEDCGVAVTGVGFSYLRASKAEEYLLGRTVDGPAVRRAAEIAAEEVHPAPDRRASPAYKRDMVRVLGERALERARARATARRA